MPLSAPSVVIEELRKGTHMDEPDEDLARATIESDGSIAQTKAVAKCTRCLTLPESECVLAEYVPVYRFGRLSSAQAVTVSINPAENKPGSKSLPVLSDFNCGSRIELTDDHIAMVSEGCNSYFEGDDPHDFFSDIEQVAVGLNAEWTYASGKLAHIDAVACVTRPIWSGIRPAALRRTIAEKCSFHFKSTLRLIPSGCWLLCDGRTVLDTVQRAGVVMTLRGSVHGKKKEVEIYTGSFAKDGRTLKVIGWNWPAHTHTIYPVIQPQKVGEAVKAVLQGIGW
jgi:hypothetical protein